MHQQLWGYKVEWKSVSRGTGGKKVSGAQPDPYRVALPPDREIDLKHSDVLT
jgi:hypothetical protein